MLYNRAQVVIVTLLEETIEAQLDPGYDVATERVVRVLLSNGDPVRGACASIGRAAAIV